MEGLYESPTVINNVETLCNVPHIVKRGADWFKSQGTEKAPGTKMFTISGKVERPGNYELPLGTPFRVLLEEYAGGMLDGGTLKAWTPGGSSTPMLTAEHLDVGLDFESIAAAGSLLGTGACMVMDQSDCIVEAARRLLEFYAHESCGKCTPCREGTWWAERVLGRIEDGYGRPEDMPLLSEVGGNILFRAFCALADGAVSPISSTLQYFMDEYEAHVRARPVPAEHRGAGPGRRGGGRLVSAPMVTLTIDGKEVTVPAGTLIIRAAEQLGIEIPRFCDHPLLDPVGACRQCYVEIEGQRKLFTSCTTTVAPGMVVMTQNTSPQVEDAQVANLEFLLLNHPLDCPICDRGGECPLQDQALTFGPGESRYIEAKRTYPKPLALSPLVGLDRERCVPVRALHAVLRSDLRRPLHRAVRPRRRGTGGDRAGRGFPLAVQREHDPDLPGGRADGHAVPVRRAAVRSLDRSTPCARIAAPAATSSSTCGAARSCGSSRATTSRSTTRGSATRAGSRSGSPTTPAGSRRR